jgi:hypothetical protein
VLAAVAKPTFRTSGERNMKRFRLAILGAIICAVICLIAWWLISFMLYVGPAQNYAIGGAILGFFAGLSRKLDYAR